MKYTHVSEIETLFSKREKGETTVVFPVARQHQRKVLAYTTRICYFYGNIW